MNPENQKTIAIFLDESGNTGPDLLNTEQPYYILTSVSEDSLVVYDQLRSQFPASGELHYVELKRQYSPLSLARLIADYFTNNRHAKSFIVNKRFMLIGKILDYLVEPQLRRSGVDYYVDSMARSHADLIYFFFTNYMSENERLLFGKSFISMVKKPCTATIDTFYQNLESLCDRGEFGLPEQECAILCRSRRHIREELEKNPYARDPLDPCIPAFFELVADWIRSRKEVSFTYDRSTPISRSITTIKAFFEDQERESIGYGRGKYVLTPSTIRFVEGDSSSSPLLQISDILSGVLYDLCMQRIQFEDEGTTGTASNLFDSVIVGSVMPSPLDTEYPADPPFPKPFSNMDLFTARLLEKLFDPFAKYKRNSP